MPPKPTDNPTLQIRKISQSLFGRIKAAADLVGVERDEWVITILEDEVRRLEKSQEEFKREWQQKLARKQEPPTV